MANIILAKCIEKLRNDKGIIQSYRLVDTKGHIGLMGAEQLKQGIRAGRIRVVNLTLTSDNRLVDGATEKKKAKTIVVRKAEPSKTQDTTPVNETPTNRVSGESIPLNAKTIQAIKDAIEKLLGTIAIKDTNTLIDIIISGNVDVDKIIKATQSGAVGGMIMPEVFIMAKGTPDNKLNVLVGTKGHFEFIDGDMAFKDFLRKCNLKNKVQFTLKGTDFDKLYSARFMFENAAINKLVICGKATKLIDMYKMCYSSSIKDVNLSEFIVPHVTRTARLLWNEFDSSTNKMLMMMNSKLRCNKKELREKFKACFDVRADLSGLDLKHTINAALMCGTSFVNKETLRSLGLAERKLESALVKWDENDPKRIQYVADRYLEISNLERNFTTQLNGKLTIGKEKAVLRKSKAERQNVKKQLKKLIGKYGALSNKMNIKLKVIEPSDIESNSYISYSHASDETAKTVENGISLLLNAMAEASK